MGGGAHVVVVADDPQPLIETAVARIAQLERRWSRFIATSEVSRLARAGGRPLRVSADTVLALSCAVAGWEATAGRFDPSVGRAMAALGYDRSFDDIASAALPATTANSPGCAGLQIDTDTRYVTAPAGVSIDLGGIGKGLAADIVATELLEAGADGVCVNLGGDLRVIGTPPVADAWYVAVEDPRDRSAEVAHVALSEGAVATSNADGRTWRAGTTLVRHVLDPATGLSVAPVGAVTVVAGECWWAEVLATAATVAGEPEMSSLVPALGGELLHVADTGEITTSAGFAAYVV
jgi:thiamine biosynthesis lipoprotein